MKYVFILSLFALVGCVSDQPTIQTVKSWEGHYMSVEDFNKQTNNIKLDKDESIWVLSNRTLKRVLKNNEGGNK